MSNGERDAIFINVVGDRDTSARERDARWVRYNGGERNGCRVLVRVHAHRMKRWERSRVVRGRGRAIRLTAHDVPGHEEVFGFERSDAWWGRLTYRECHTVVVDVFRDHRVETGRAWYNGRGEDNIMFRFRRNRGWRWKIRVGGRYCSNGAVVRGEVLEVRVQATVALEYRVILEETCGR